MSNNNNNNNKIIMFAVVVVSVIVLIWLVYPKTEKFDKVNTEKTQETTPEMKQENVQEKTITPFVDPKIGTLMDGPGFERPPIDGAFIETPELIPSNYYFLDDGANGEFSIQHNLCSKSCCSEQWPTPFKQKYDPYVCANKDKFVPSNIFCNNSFQDSGCLCLTKKQAQFLYNRGGNGREWF